MSHSSNKSSKTPRRFFPEPIETSSRRSKNNQPSPSFQDRKTSGKNSHDQELNPHRRHFVRPFDQAQLISELPNGSRRRDHIATPEWIQTTPPAGHKVSRGSWSQKYAIRTSLPATQPENNGHEDEMPVKQDRPRKFTPQLMGTARHSFRREGKPLDLERSLERTNTLNDISSDISTHSVHESRFSYSSILRRQEARRHSFRVPDLPAIPSSCSEESNGPDPPPKPSSIPAIRLNSNEQADSVYESHFREHVLPNSVQSPENQLKEQALAAFPNEQVYQPVDHFAIDREEDEFNYLEEPTRYTGKPYPRTYRRASSADLPWELEYMRRHKEELGMSNRHLTTSKGSPLVPADLQATNSTSRSVNSRDGWDKDRDLTRLRHSNRPPMLGSDLIFPQSLTPEMTICEGTTDFVDLNTECRQSFHGYPGLWSANPRPPHKPHDGGLWMGTCKIDLYNPKLDDPVLSGILTPIHMEADAWKHSSEISTTGGPNQFTCYTIRKTYDTTNSKREFDGGEGDILEFDDGFVTQIYNYLSLGYPSVARYYDCELSKVSGVSVATLRGDDLNTDATGHVSVQDTTVGGGAGKGVCMRWVALRLYIQEWARQHPHMEEDRNHGTWGVRERKGSWAI